MAPGIRGYELVIYGIHEHGKRTIQPCQPPADRAQRRNVTARGAAVDGDGVDAGVRHEQLLLRRCGHSEGRNRHESSQTSDDARRPDPASRIGLRAHRLLVIPGDPRGRMTPFHFAPPVSLAVKPHSASADIQSTTRSFADQGVNWNGWIATLS